jgi:hypothetical protein
MGLLLTLLTIHPAIFITIIIMKQTLILIIKKDFISFTLKSMLHLVIPQRMHPDLAMTLAVSINKVYPCRQEQLLIFQRALGILATPVLQVWQVVPEPMVMHLQQPMLTQLQELMAQQLQELMVKQAVVVV